MAQIAPVPAPFQSASLYVGDLNPDVAENVLFDIFNRVGPVASIRVCRDSMTRRSLGYAYVNFHDVRDAELTLDTMNFRDIQGRPCRIMWSQRDPSLRRNGLGNIFVRNLAPSVDNKGLNDIFSVFGNILSCKVAQDEHGVSKRYGYVHFETAEAAQDAISKLDGMLIEDVKVSLTHFVRRQDRNTAQHWTNLYVKQFPVSWDEDKLKSKFSPFGTVQSVFIAKDLEGKSKAFGFVNFETNEAAAKALEALHNAPTGEKVQLKDALVNQVMYVSKAQKKMERERDMKVKQDAVRLERVTKYQNMNLYVKNIAESVTDEQFAEAFGVYGKISSARIMRENNETKTSKGFGFVCYSTVDEANKAVAEMNGKLLGGKPLVVTLYQRQEQRRQQLAANFAPHAMRFGGPGMQMPFPVYPQAFPGQPTGPRGQFAQFPGAPVPRGMPRGMPAGAPMAPYGRGPYPVGPAGPYMGAPQGGFRGPRGGVPQGMPRAVPNPRGMYGAPAMAAPYVGAPQGHQGPRGGAGIKFNAQARNQMAGTPQAAPVAHAGAAAAVAAVPGQKLDFSQALLATTDPALQKNMIGEKLYPLIYASQPELAGKITGMLLEMDNAELINLIESPEALASKIEEALAVLRSHTAE